MSQYLPLCYLLLPLSVCLCLWCTTVFCQDKRRLAEIHKLEKQREKAEKQLQKEIEKAKKQATTASRKDDHPAERLKRMVVILDKAIAENSDLMAGIAGKLSECEVEYRISQEGEHPGIISWRRKCRERTVDDQAQVISVGLL